MRQCSSNETVPWRCCTVAQQARLLFNMCHEVSMWQTALADRDLPVGIGRVSAVHQSNVHLECTAGLGLYISDDVWQDVHTVQMMAAAHAQRYDMMR